MNNDNAHYILKANNNSPTPQRNAYQPDVYVAKMDKLINPVLAGIELYGMGLAGLPIPKAELGQALGAAYCRRLPETFKRTESTTADDFVQWCEALNKTHRFESGDKLYFVRTPAENTYGGRKSFMKRRMDQMPGLQPPPKQQRIEESEDQGFPRSSHTQDANKSDEAHRETDALSNIKWLPAESLRLILVRERVELAKLRSEESSVEEAHSIAQKAVDHAQEVVDSAESLSRNIGAARVNEDPAIGHMSTAAEHAMSVQTSADLHLKDTVTAGKRTQETLRRARASKEEKELRIRALVSALEYAEAVEILEVIRG